MYPMITVNHKFKFLIIVIVVVCYSLGKIPLKVKCMNSEKKVVPMARILRIPKTNFVGHESVLKHIVHVRTCT